jgi:DNA-binding NtrC family response regulator
VVNIKIPPLRDRKEDIPALVSHFLSRAGGNYTLTAETLEAMLSYDWPGNIRELENCIQHMVAINSGPLLHVADLPSNLQNHLREKKSQYLMAAASALPSTTSAEQNGSEPDASPDAAARPPFSTVIPLSELERRAILNALEYTKGDRAVAAHLLGIGRTTLYRKLKEYQLVP